MRRNRFCFFHKRWHEQRVVLGSTAIGSPSSPSRKRQSKPALDLPVLEDANSVQVALMQVMHLLLSGQIEHKTASLLLYGLQTASSNLRQVTFDPSNKEKIVIDPRSVDETPLGATPWSNDDYLNEIIGDDDIADEDTPDEIVPSKDCSSKTIPKKACAVSAPADAALTG